MHHALITHINKMVGLLLAQPVVMVIAAQPTVTKFMGESGC